MCRNIFVAYFVIFLLQFYFVLLVMLLKMETYLALVSHFPDEGTETVLCKDQQTVEMHARYKKKT